MDDARPTTTPASGSTAEYGIDAPGVVLTFLALGVISLTLTAFAAGGNAPFLVSVFTGFAVISMLTCFAMFMSSKSGKRKLWRRTLDGLALRGDEEALDLGCGRGLVLVETAKRVPDGHATGIDIWRSKDQSGNHHSVTDANVQVEGVADRVTILDADMRDLPFDDDRFDLVTASLAIHNIRERAGRDAAVGEIVRVLKPGGRVVIIDIAKTSEYRDVLRGAGFNVDVVFPRPDVYPPVKTLIARKPAVGATP